LEEKPVKAFITIKNNSIKAGKTVTNDEIAITSACRTPFGRFLGALKGIDYFDLGAIPMKEVLKRVNLEGNVVDEVFWGVGDTSVCKDVFTPVAARQTLLKAGLPPETPSISLDKACVSAMSAVKLATMAIKLGEIDTAIAGGATSFSRVPLIVRGSRVNGFRVGDQMMEDPCFMLRYRDFTPVSVDADNVAYECGITREEMDEWALRSHYNYGKAWKAGKFKDEMISVEIPQPKGEPINLNIDEQYRANASMEKLSKLKPMFGTKAITPGNAPGLNDGATAIVMMTRKKANELGVEVLGTISTMVSIALKPDRMAEAPAVAIKKLLNTVSLSLEDIHVMEINEAFAAVPLVSIEMLSNGDKTKAKEIKQKTNINGSAIATGHPNTATGARIMMNLLYELRRRGGGYAIGALCGGLAQADACLIKV
jgi:acetyl-CoA C-acetyltransferase